MAPRRTTDVQGTQVGDIDYDGASFSPRDYRNNPNRVWQKVRKRDVPWGFKPGVDIQMAGGAHPQPIGST